MSEKKLEKFFRDPVHNIIEVKNQTIYDLINTKEFQRLRRIKQLGTASFTFHGAEHSRFSHCLGVYNIARIITEKFTESEFEEWDPAENLVTQCAGLLHDIGHGAYSHTFEGLFETDHEAITREIITSPTTEVNAVLKKIAPDFPEKVASVISHEYPNQQVVQLISSQIDADRMDYLLRDAYYSGAVYGQFDLTRILNAIRPVPNGIAFKYSGMRAVEDYIISRYQMYMQVYFHPASRAMEVLLAQLLHRAKHLYAEEKEFFKLTAPCLIPFFEADFTLEDYLRLDDGVMNSYFQAWIASAQDEILKDLSSCYINRKVWKSVTFTAETESSIAELKAVIEQSGFDPNYYTACHSSFDLPYDVYRPKVTNPRTSIQIIKKDGHLAELSELSPLVASLSGNSYGDNRFYFPKAILENPNFNQLIKNGEII